ncbi:MAG: zinc transport system substrate-binding protein [Nitrospirae bacterium]|nr:MAG: zinc transport system substrate-binding protein [Nitrospirota bacterium]
MKKFQIVLIILLLLAAQNSYAEKLKVVASIFPLGDIAKQVGGERVDVKIMLPPGVSPHTFEPTPPEMMQLQNAMVFIKAGAGLEFWAAKMLRAAGNEGLIVVDASSGLPLIRDIHSYKSEAGHYKPQGCSEIADPHVWLDPVFAKAITDKITSALSKADPSGSAYYMGRADKYKKDLDILHNEISDKVKTFKVKEYVTFHPAWEYFSKRYGLRVAGVIEESPGREPSPKHIARIIREVKRINSKVVFAEPQFNPAIAEVIAEEAGAKVLFLDPIGGSNIKGRDTYLGLMRYNLSVMEGAMK